MISIVATSLMIFSLAYAENRAEKQREPQESSEDETPTEKEDKTETKKEMTPEERFDTEQSLHRIRRDQRNIRRDERSLSPPPPPIKLPTK